MAVYFKIHKHPKETVIAVCDDDIVGRTFRSDGMKLFVSEAFYGGELIGEEEFRSRLDTFTIVNLAGNRVVDIAIEEGVINPENVLVIGGVKHAQAVIL